MIQITLSQVIADRKLDTLPLIFKENPTAQIVKYSIEKRCLLQIEKEAKVYFVKVYPKKFLKHERGEKIHGIGKKLWQFSRQNKVNFIVPKPIGWESKTRTIWQEEVTGKPAINFSPNENKVNIPFEIGKGVGIISKLEITPPRFFDRREQLKDSHEFAEKILDFAPSLQEKLELIFELLEKARLPLEKLVPIHGDMHIDQWLFDGNKLGLLDFEDFSLGEIERDLASFIVQIKTEYPFIDDDFVNSFLMGFRANGTIEDERLMNYYAAHKWIAKAAKDEKEAQRLLDKALNCLELIY